MTWTAFDWYVCMYVWFVCMVCDVLFTPFALLPLDSV